MSMRTPPAFEELVYTLVRAWTPKPILVQYEEKSMGCLCCSGGIDNPKLNHTTGEPCRDPKHNTYWDLYDQLKDNDLI